MYSMSRIYLTWDRSMVGRDPDYVKLYKQMLPISTDKSLNNALDFWWRFSAVTFGCTNGFSPATQRKDYLAKLSESKKYGEKSLKIAPKHFAAHLILGKVMQEMACLDSDTKRRTTQLAALVKHLKEAQAQQPENWQVCLLEAQANIHLYKLTPAYKSTSTLKTAPPPPVSPIPTYSLMPLSVIEIKLRRILYYAPHSLELFRALVDTVQLQGRASEAACIAMYASKLEQANPKEKYLGTCLAKFKVPEKSETKKRHAKEKSSKKSVQRGSKH